jgi:hypothetical protein
METVEWLPDHITDIMQVFLTVNGRISGTEE